MNRHRNRAFAVETLLLTLFFLLALALLVQLFGAAQAMGRQARQETDAALLLQNASAQLHAGAEDSGCNLGLHIPGEFFGLEMVMTHFFIIQSHSKF